MRLCSYLFWITFGHPSAHPFDARNEVDTVTLVGEILKLVDGVLS